MLNSLLKKLGIDPDVKKEEVDMSVENIAVQVDLANHEAVVAELATLKEGFEAAQAAVESFKTQLETITAVKEAIEAELAEVKAAAKTKMIAERTAKLSALAGEEKATAVMATLAEASEETFEAVMGAMAASYAAEEKSELFTEKGLDAKPAPVAAKDVVTRLAENIAAQTKTK